MFLKSTDRDISDKEFEEILLPHYKVVSRFLEEYVIPEVIAFYLASGFYGSCVYEESYRIHINSIVKEIFNCEISNMKELKRNIKKLLIVKYGLEIVDEDPLDFKELKV